MSNTNVVPVEANNTVEATSTVEETNPVEILNEIGGASADSADSETVVTEFSTKTKRDDLILVVDGKQLHVCTSVLAFASPVFDAMFTDDFQEKGKKEITLPGKSLEHVVEFLKCIYPGMIKPVTMENVFKVLHLADEYQVKSLKSACEVCLLSQLSATKKMNDVYVILEPACVYGLQHVKRKCIDMIAERSHEEFDEAAKQASFPDDVQNEIRSKLMQALSLKHKALCGRLKTSEVLNLCLGEMASQRDLVDEYLSGRVIGNLVTMKVNSKYNAIAELIIGVLRFSISLDTRLIEGCDVVRVKIECQTQRSITCMCYVIIRNWLQEKRDEKRVSTLRFSDRKALNGIEFKGISTRQLENETTGFMYKGTIDVSVYVFCTGE